MIQDVTVTLLKVIEDGRGRVMRMMRRDDAVFERFGEVYFSVVNPGVVKGWKKHLKMTQHLAVPSGKLRMALYDGREGSSTNGEVLEIETGADNYRLVKIPPLVWYSFGALGDGPALVANCTDLVHDPEESVTCDLSDESIPYDWSVKRP